MMLFPGQGSQCIKMGEYCYQNFKVAREIYEEASDILHFDVAKLCLQGRLSQLCNFKNMQIAVVVTEVALFYSFLEQCEVEPKVLLGHSVGEYAALTCSKAIKFCDVLRILDERYNLIKQSNIMDLAGMTIVDYCSDEMIHKWIKTLDIQDRVFISCYNASTQYALSGYRKEMDLIEAELVKEGAKVAPLLMSPPLHSDCMCIIQSQYEDIVNGVNYNKCEIPVYSNVSGEILAADANIADELVQQLCKPVKMEQSVRDITEHNVECVIELSQRAILSNLFLQENVKKFTYGIEEDRNRMRF